MKILDFNSYNEKIKANSINLSDLKDIEIDDKLEFTKKSLVHGRVVQFADKTYGMFVAPNSKLFKKNAKALDLYNDMDEGVFFCYFSDFDKRLVTEPLSFYEDDLMYLTSDISSVIKIYKQLMPKEIYDDESFTQDYNFFNTILNFVRDKKDYIERTI